MSRETLEELFDLARFAPNHHLTQPWRFRVLGPDALARLKEAGGEKEAAKLGRAPTLVVASVALAATPSRTRRTLRNRRGDHAVLLAATERGIASYWRTPGVLRTTPAARRSASRAASASSACSTSAGRAREPAAREREPVESYVQFLP